MANEQATFWQWTKRNPWWAVGCLSCLIGVAANALMVNGVAVMWACAALGMSASNGALSYANYKARHQRDLFVGLTLEAQRLLSTANSLLNSDADRFAANVNAMGRFH